MTQNLVYRLSERVLVSTDGGRTFTTALTALDILGFAISADGATVWASAAGGVYRSSDRGATFARVSADVTRVGCLAVHGEAVRTQRSERRLRRERLVRWRRPCALE